MLPSEFCRLRGELELQIGEASAGTIEPNFQKGLEIARRHGAKLWE